MDAYLALAKGSLILATLFGLSVLLCQTYVPTNQLMIVWNGALTTVFGSTSTYCWMLHSSN